MIRPVDAIRTVTILFACFAASHAMATDITFSMSGSGVYCAGGNASVNYTVTGVTLVGGNTLTAQLSNSSGSFAAPDAIGSLNTTSPTGTINITFPGGASGNGYKIRITSSNNAFTGTAGNAFAINQVLAPSVTITAVPSTTVGAGSVVYFSSTPANGGSAPAFEWKKNGNNAGTGDSYVLPDAADGDQIQVVMTPVCASPSTATSNTITVLADPNMTQTDHSWASRATQPDGMGGFINRSNASGFTVSSPAPMAYIGCGSSSITNFHKDLWAYNPQTDTWSQQADLPGVGRYNAVGFSVGLKGFIGMGMTGSGAVKDFYEYQVSSNTWQIRNPLPGVVREQAFGFGIGGTVMKGYVGGGVSSGADLKDFYEFDTSGNTWSVIGGKPDFAGGKRIGAGSFVVGDKGYVVGGYSSTTDTYYKDLYEYDPIGVTWTARTSMPGTNGRTRPTAFGLAGNGYVGMGYSANRYEGTFYQYNVVGDSWTQKPYYPGPTTRTFGVGLTVGNRSFVYKDGRMHEYDLFTLSSFPSKLCSTETINVNYDASGFTFNVGNFMTAEISSTPSFAVVTTLATKGINTATGSVTAQIPTSVATGNYYFRIKANNPPMTTLLEMITVTRVETNHIVTAEGGTSVCVGVPVTFSSNLTGTGFTWLKNDIEVGTDASTYLANDLVDQDEIKATRTYTVGCNAPVDVTSSPLVTMNVRTPTKPTVSVVPPNVLQSTNATAFQWYKDNVAIANAKNQTYQMTENGVYKVKITDNAGCSRFSDDQVNVYTGLENQSYNVDVLAYPSPFSESMFLSVADHIVAQGCDFTLMNELGQTVVNKQRAETINKLDLTGRAPGLYILHISFGQNTLVRKLIKLN
jgi:hypothetical protein